MSGTTPWPWAALFLLGAYHGINPGMGWLFAVALAMRAAGAATTVSKSAPLTRCSRPFAGGLPAREAGTRRQAVDVRAPEHEVRWAGH